MTFIFKHGSQTADQILRQDRYPEVAFVGRSNVGKSSLLNAVANQKDLARISKTPGRTRQINYFLDEKRKFYLVDLPGYGFAKLQHKMIRDWRHLMDAYFINNAMLKKVFVLIDARRGIMDSDKVMIQYLRDHQYDYHLVFTKCDKKEAMTEFPKKSVQTSSVEKTGIEELKGLLEVAIN